MRETISARVNEAIKDAHDVIGALYCDYPQLPHSHLCIRVGMLLGGEREKTRELEEKLNRQTRVVTQFLLGGSRLSGPTS